MLKLGVDPPCKGSLWRNGWIPVQNNTSMVQDSPLKRKRAMLLSFANQTCQWTISHLYHYLYTWCSQLETSVEKMGVNRQVGWSIYTHPNLHGRSCSDWESRPLLCGAPWSSKCVPAREKNRTNHHERNSDSNVQNRKMSSIQELYDS